jgi:hypothetical protein
MDILQERIPMLITRAVSFEADRSPELVSLMTAERQLQSLGVPRKKDRWLRNRRATDIATAWFSITGNVDEAERCLQTCIGNEASTIAWTETASALRSALGLKWYDRSLDDRMRRYIVKAEEFADSCHDWCECASAWRCWVADNDRALSCLSRADECAGTFFDYVCCAQAWRTYDYQKVTYWVSRASEKVLTAQGWLRCAELMHYCEKDDPETQAIIDCYLTKAEAITRSHEGYIEWVFCADMCFGARGIERVMRALTKAEEVIEGMNDWCLQVATVMALKHRSHHLHEPVAGFANQDELESYYNQCMTGFARSGPTTQDWLKLVQRRRWKEPDDTDRHFMVRAEAAAHSSQDWQDCAKQWIELKLPESKKRAIASHLRSRQTWKPNRLR